MSKPPRTERWTATQVENTAEQRDRAARYICAQAADADDARQLLEAVGLL